MNKACGCLNTSGDNLKHWQTVTTTLLLTLSASLQAGEPGTLIKKQRLKTKPFADASSSGTLEASTRIEIISRQGAWMVKPAKGQRLVRMLNVRTDAASQAADSGIDKLGKLYKTGSSGSAVTTGVGGCLQKS